MSALGEKTLFAHLTEVDSLDTIAREGIDPKVIPTETLRPVLIFAVAYYHDSGRTRAPSEAVLRAEYGDILDDNEITFDEPEDSVEWAIDDLKGSYVSKEASLFNRRFATAMAEAQTAEKLEVLAEHASELVALSITVEDQSFHADAREAMEHRITAYEQREADRDRPSGMGFGLPEIDAYTRHVHDGELAVLAAGPKVGKSYFLDYVALHEWEAGRATALYTLENSVEVTLDRIACLATGVSSQRWFHGRAVPEEIEMVRKKVLEFKESDVPLWVLQPELGKRSVEALVWDAQLRDSQSLLIDQLTFLELPNPRKPKNERIGDALHTLKGMISTGRDRLPCLLAHQINRDGVKSADKVGYLEMHHMAESAEVERTADWVFGLYRSRDDVSALQARFQTLASRRDVPQHFLLTWNVDGGFISVNHTIELGD